MRTSGCFQEKRQSPCDCAQQKCYRGRGEAGNRKVLREKLRKVFYATTRLAQQITPIALRRLKQHVLLQETIEIAIMYFEESEAARYEQRKEQPTSRMNQSLCLHAQVYVLRR